MSISYTIAYPSVIPGSNVYLQPPIVSYPSTPLLIIEVTSMPVMELWVKALFIETNAPVLPGFPP
jgi:hypothetical protein